jgi:maleate isomerase
MRIRPRHLVRIDAARARLQECGGEVATACPPQAAPSPRSKNNGGASASMVDSLGFRMKFGVIAPSTNTSVQPEFDAMRPHGVTNHFARIYIPDDPIKDNADFDLLMQNIRKEMMSAIDRVMTCRPQKVIMGMSAETFWDGLAGSKEFQQRCKERAGVSIAMGSDACQAALRRYGSIKRISVITPYMPSGDAQVRRSFTDSGFEVVNLLGLKSNSPLLMAHEAPERLRRAVREVDDSSVELILQVGTNLAFAAVAAEAERWLGKPVLAVNTCTYWHALRSTGIEDKIEGFGSLLTEH